MSCIQKLLNFRQAGLKLFMNVIYGYTGATFSGRMPSADIADSIVESGRFILTQVFYKRIYIFEFFEIFI